MIQSTHTEAWTKGKLYLTLCVKHLIMCLTSSHLDSTKPQVYLGIGALLPVVVRTTACLFLAVPKCVKLCISLILAFVHSSCSPFMKEFFQLLNPLLWSWISFRME